MRSSNSILNDFMRLFLLIITVHSPLSPYPSLFLLLDRLQPKLGLQLSADARNFSLTREEDEDSAGRQSCMNFRSLFDGLRDIVWVRPPAEVDGDGMLARSDADDGRRGREKIFVLCKVAHAEGGRHDN